MLLLQAHVFCNSVKCFATRRMPSANKVEWFCNLYTRRHAFAGRWMHSAYIVEYICSKTGDTSADKSEYIVAKHIAFYKQIEVHLQHWDEFCVHSPLPQRAWYGVNWLTPGLNIRTWQHSASSFQPPTLSPQSLCQNRPKLCTRSAARYASVSYRDKHPTGQSDQKVMCLPLWAYCTN